MPLIKKAYEKNRMGDAARILTNTIIVAVVLFAMSSWNLLWQKVFAMVLVASSSYVLYRMVYYLVCEQTFIREPKDKRTGRKYRNNELVWEEWRGGLIHLPQRIIGATLFVVTSNVLLFTRSGIATIYAGILTTVGLAIAYIGLYANPEKTPAPEIVAKNEKALAKWNAAQETYAEACKDKMWRNFFYFAGIIGLEIMLLSLTTAKPPLNDAMKGLLFINLWPGLGMVGFSLVFMMITGRNFFMFLPAAFIPFWYGMEYLLGYQLIPTGHLESGFDRIFLPLFLGFTLMMDTAAMIRRKFFVTPADYRSMLEDAADGINFS
ncbi:MAG TPA: hypothetical protein PLB38_02575 [bacterium]|nr:hypothetical protein [bacterium]